MLCQKDKFSLSKEQIYLNGAYMSPMLKSVEKVGIEGLRLKCNPFDIKISHFYDDLFKLKKAYTQLLGFDDFENVAIIPSVSYGMANAARAIKLEKGKQKIILVGEQFPSNYYTWHTYANENNLQLQIVNKPMSGLGADWNNELLAKINSDTLLISMPNVHWADGTVFNLNAISEKAKYFGAKLVIDGTQSFGAFPFDNREINADIVIAASYKWLLGPYSIGFAYYNDELCQGKPIEESWINRDKSEDFKNLVNYQSQYKSGASRYQMGEAPNFINVPMALKATEQLIEWQPKQVQSYCRNITADCIDKLSNAGYVIDNEGVAHHLFGVRCPNYIDLDHVKYILDNEQIIVSYRGQSIRIAPNVYNSMEDVKKLTSVLSSIAG